MEGAMKLPVTLLLSTLALAVPGFARAASVDLKNVYANLEIIPEDRADVAVEVRASDGKLPQPTVTRSGGDVLVDGQLSAFHTCSGIHLGHTVYLSGHGWIGASSALSIIVRTPRDAHITVSGAVIGNVHAAQDFELRTSGCSQWRIANVSGTLSIRQSGEAMILAGDAGKATLDLSGLTRVDLAAVHALNVDMSGMGKVRLKSISGPVDASLSGMGSVNIAGGRAERVKADVSGMGAFSLRGSAAELDADVSGIGGVHVDHVYGEVKKSVSGIGRVSVGA
jgi:hypothetical protein